MAQIRHAKSEDAPGLIALFKQLDVETTFMLFEPEERIITVEQQTDVLSAFKDSTSQAMFVAESKATILGFAVGIGGSVHRNRHSISLVIGVLQAYWNKGIGGDLIQALEAWAKARKMHRLELSVMAHNSRAIAFYEKHGFEREGIKRDALRIKGNYVNEIYMSKLI